MSAISFEPTVTAGLIIQTLFLGTGLFWFLWGLRNELSLVKANVHHLEEAQKALTEAFAQLGRILTQVAVQDTRLSMMEKRIDELAHGRGIIQ